LGLTKFYKDPRSVEHFLKLFFGMPFLKPSDVEEYFLGLCEILPCNNSGIVQFSDYIIDNYISEEALFLPHIWVLRTKTINGN
jgi:hypothetical protein